MFQPPAAANSDSGKGIVMLDFGLGRTLLPSTYSFAAYKFTFTPTAPINDRVVTPFNELLDRFELEVGPWSLNVEVYSDAGAQNLAASASGIQLTVANATPVTETVPLVFVSMEGTGTLTYTVTNNSGAIDQAEIILTPLGNQAGKNILLTENLTGSDSSIAAGYFLATVRMEKDKITPIGNDTFTGAKRAVWSDILHIYPGQTTNLAATFGANDFHNGIKNIWLFGHMTGWNVTDNDWNDKKLNSAEDGTFIWKGDVMTTDRHFRFALTDTSNWTPNNDSNRKGGAWFVPAVSGNAVIGSAGNEMTLLPLHHNNLAAVERTWQLAETGYYEITVDPVAYRFTVQRPVIVEAVTVQGPPSVKKGASTIAGDFTATVTGKNITSQEEEVTWSILGITHPLAAGTIIHTTTGILTVDASEENTEITVIATSVINTLIPPGTVTVGITSAEILPKPGIPGLSAEGVATWVYAGDTNVTGYLLQLYKGETGHGNEVSIAKGIFTHNFLAAMRSEGEGVYSFTVTAVGDGIDYATSSESEKSDARTITALASPGERWWDGNTARWAAVTGAESHSVKIFKNGVDHWGPQTSDTSSTFDAAAIFASPEGGTGSYTFTVTAIAPGTGLVINSPESDPVPNAKHHLNIIVSASTVFGGSQINGIAFGNGIFVAVGSSSTAMTSGDGNNWTIVPANSFAPSWDAAARPDLYAITYGGTGFVAVGQWGHIFHSTNGTNWTRIEGSSGDPFPGWGERPNLNSVTHDGTRFVTAGASIGSGARTANSTDGINWTFVENGSTGNNQIFGIASGGGRIVTVGNGGRVTWSSNGSAWSGGTNGNWVSDNIFNTGAHARAVAFGNNRWVIAGDDGRIAYATDPTAQANWTRLDGYATRFRNDGNNGNVGILNVIFANGMFVAMGSNGRMSTSPDGIEWTAIPRGTPPAGNLSGFGNEEQIRAAAFGNNRFVFGGNAYAAGTASKITYSN